MTLHGTFLLLAALVQVGWLYNIKWLDKDKLRAIRWHTFFTRRTLMALLPLFLYIILGLSNVALLTFAMKKIPASTAYAIWTGIVLALATLADKWIFKQQIGWKQYFFLGLLAVGIIGLKYSANL